MQFVFGSGQLFAQPEGFDSGANSPVLVGALRGVAVEMGFNPKALHGGGHWPLAIGRGTGKVPCKAEFAQFSADGFNTLFFGGPVPTTGCTRAATDEAHVIAGNAATPLHAGTFALDLGVTAQLPSGALFTRVASAPGAHEYTVDEETGDYGFAPDTDGTAVRLSYLYADTSNGREITIANRTIGHTPRFSAVLTETFNGKAMTLTLPHCVASRLGFRSKANDFMVPSFSFGAAADDSGLVGTLSLEEGADYSTQGGGQTLALFNFNRDYPFNDQTLYHHNVTPHGVEIFDGELTFAGQGDSSYVLGGAFPTLLLPSTGWTIQAYVTPPEIAIQRFPTIFQIVSEGAPGVPGAMVMLRFDREDQPGQWELFTTVFPAFTTGVWPAAKHHVCVMSDGVRGAALWVNGTRVTAFVTISDALGDSPLYLVLGTQTDGIDQSNGSGFNGSISSFKASKGVLFEDSFVPPPEPLLLDSD